MTKIQLRSYNTFKMFNFQDDEDGTPFFNKSYCKGSLFQSQPQQQTSAFDLFNNNKHSKRSIIEQLDNFNKSEAFYSLIDNQSKDQNFKFRQSLKQQESKDLEVSFENPSTNWKFQDNRLEEQKSQIKKMKVNKEQKIDLTPKQISKRQFKFLKNHKNNISNNIESIKKDKEKREIMLSNKQQQRPIFKTDFNLPQKNKHAQQQHSQNKTLKSYQSQQKIKHEHKKGLSFHHKFNESKQQLIKQHYQEKINNQPKNNETQKMIHHQSKFICHKQPQQIKLKTIDCTKPTATDCQTKKPSFVFQKKASLQTIGLKAQLAQKQKKKENSSLNFCQLKPRSSVNKFSIASKQSICHQGQLPTSIKILKKQQLESNNIKTTSINKQQKYFNKNSFCFMAFLESFEDLANKVKSKKEYANKVKQGYKDLYALSNFNSQLVRENLRGI